MGTSDQESNNKEDGSDNSESSERRESSHKCFFINEGEDTLEAIDPRAKVLTVLELEELFAKAAPELSCTCYLFETPMRCITYTHFSLYRFLW